MAKKVVSPRDIVASIVGEADHRRRKLIGEIEQATRRNVINYSATSFGYFSEQMQASDVFHLTRVMAKGPGLAGADLILNSAGGLPEAGEKIIMTLRHFYDNDLRVIVPESAKSAATIVALGADSIVMGYCSELGPIDPQMYVSGQPGQQGVFRSAHAIIRSVDSYVDKVHEAIKGGQPFEAYLRLLDFCPDLAFVEECRLAESLSKSIAERWLKETMLKGDPSTAEETAEKLSRADKLYSHGRAIDHRFARHELKLNVEYLPPEHDLWQRVWELHIRTTWPMLQNRQAKIIESRVGTLSFQQ